MLTVDSNDGGPFVTMKVFLMGEDLIAISARVWHVQYHGIGIKGKEALE